MKLALFLAFLCLVAVAQAEKNPFDQDEVTVVKITNQENHFPIGPLSLLERLSSHNPFHNFFGRSSSPFSSSNSLLHKLFHFPVFESQDDQPTLTIQIIEQDQDDNEPLQAFSKMFSGIMGHMQKVMSEIQQQQDQDMPLIVNLEQEDDKQVRSGCPLLRVCAADIDSFCAVARLSQTVGAIEHCLQAHRQKLGQECGAMLDSRVHSENTQPEGEESSASPSTPPSTPPSTSEALVVVETPQEQKKVETKSVTVAPVTIEHGKEEHGKPEHHGHHEGGHGRHHDRDHHGHHRHHHDHNKPHGGEESSEESTDQPKPADQFVSKLPESCRAQAQTCGTSTTLSASPVVNTMVCLYNQKSSLSSDCLQRIGTTPLFNCALDVVKFCPHVRGQAKIIACLSQQSLSDACMTSLRNPKAADPQFDGLNAKVKDQISQVLPAGSSSKATILAVGIGFVALVVVVVAVTIFVRRSRRQQSSIVVQLAKPGQVDTQNIQQSV